MGQLRFALSPKFSPYTAKHSPLHPNGLVPFSLVSNANEAEYFDIISKSKYCYVGKIVGRHHANSKILINETTLKYTK